MTKVRKISVHLLKNYIKNAAKEKRIAFVKRCVSDCGGSRIRTDDLWVMSPVSYHCSIPRCFTGAKVVTFQIPRKPFNTY